MDDKAKKLLKQIEDTIEALATETDATKYSEIFQTYLKAIGKFHHYSFRNQLIIEFTNPNATHVAGFHDWKKKFNRNVKKGEHGIAILAPVVFTKSKGEEEPKPDSDTVIVEIESSDEAKKKGERTYISYRTVYIFDLSQTEGDPFPETPNWHDFEKNIEVETALVTFAKSKGITVEVVEDLNGADGVSSGGKIQVVEKAGTRTLVHELAHELLHWKRPELRLTLSHQQKEIEADATAYVVAQYFNLTLDSNATPNYLALKYADSKAILACFTRIREASVEIITAIESVKAQNPA